eukprot:6176418-Pleurochrysis_carterae.AAC.1
MSFYPTREFFFQFDSIESALGHVESLDKFARPLPMDMIHVTVTKYQINDRLSLVPPPSSSAVLAAHPHFDKAPEPTQPSHLRSDRAAAKSPNGWFRRVASKIA